VPQLQRSEAEKTNEGPLAEGEVGQLTLLGQCFDGVLVSCSLYYIQCEELKSAGSTKQMMRVRSQVKCMPCSQA